ncbi:hypothetical protein HZH66_003041 [Vespula vulgaris]|uniref:Uncharacterized protein n=2 Tax=Vespula TaxID=7451 RepID=A0A834KIA9_VESVU|nr:hypothetical protein HZH66_003041 [Vespula vulgaris]
MSIVQSVRSLCIRWVCANLISETITEQTASSSRKINRISWSSKRLQGRYVVDYAIELTSRDCRKIAVKFITR